MKKIQCACGADRWGMFEIRNGCGELVDTLYGEAENCRCPRCPFCMKRLDEHGKCENLDCWAIGLLIPLPLIPQSVVP